MMRAGVIGLGIGEQHVRDYLAHESIDSVLVCDLNTARARDLANSMEGVKAVSSADALLDDSSIDIVSICSYDEFHHGQTIAALRNGKHVYVEKPLCQNVEQAADIRRELDRQSHLRLSSNLVLRTCPLFESVREEVLDGMLGEIFSVDADYLWGRTAKLTEGWRGKMESYSIIQGAAVHMIDLVIWITKAKPIEVMAWGNNLATAKQGVPFEDFVSLGLRFENGMIARVGAYGGCVHPHFHRLNVYGSKGTFKHDIQGTGWLNSSTRGEYQTPASRKYPGREWRGKALHSFLNAIRGLGEPLVETRDIFNVMTICFAAEKSLKQGLPVSISYKEW